MDQLGLEASLRLPWINSLRNTSKIAMDQLALKTPLRLPWIN